MLSILHIGSASAPEEFDLQFLSAMNGTECKEFGKRHSSLPRSYVLETGNVDPSKAPSHSISTPTKLGAEAIRNGCAGAGISVENLLLIIGDTSTPLQTTPSEAQRIAGTFSLRIPAYDITALGCALSAQLSSLTKWKPDRIPEYMAIFSSNTPSLAINYRQGPESLIFGDGASAFILSRVHPGKLRIVDAYYGVVPLITDYVTIDTYGHIRVGNLPPQELIQEKLSKLSSRYKNLEGKASRTFVILPPGFEEISKRVLSSELKDFNPEFFSLRDQIGDTLGSYSGSVLASVWDNIRAGDKIFVVQFGSGFSYGSVVMEA